MSGEVRWAGGAMDGIFGGTGASDRGEEKGTEIAALFVKASKRPSKRNLTKLYESVSDDGVLGYVDPMIEKLVELDPNRADLHALGRWLATTASDRGAVKVGIAILGVTGLASDVDVVRVLGAHDEFTLFAAVAITNGLADPRPELWALARAVDGWGRIQCVRRLRDTREPEIREWILREGFRNSIMDEELAFIAATTGGLLDALTETEPDRELLTSGGEILEALVAGGPAEDLDDYDDGADAVEAFLGHMETRAETLGDFQAVATICRYLAQESGWDARSLKGWTASRRDAFEVTCAEILDRDEWDDRIAVGLLSDDPAEFWRAEQAARHRGIDTFEVHVAKIREQPLGTAWFQAWKQADRGERDSSRSWRTSFCRSIRSPRGRPPRSAWARSGVHTARSTGRSRHSVITRPLVRASCWSGSRAPWFATGTCRSTSSRHGRSQHGQPERGELAEGLVHTDPNEKTRELAAEVLRRRTE